MSLIPLTGEFSNGIISFSGLPNFTSGFFRLLIVAAIEPRNGDGSLVIEINGNERLHWYNNIMIPNGNFFPPASPLSIEQDRFILLARGGGPCVYNSEVIIGLTPGGGLVSARCNTNCLHGDANGITQAYNWLIAGGRTDQETLNSIVIRARDNNANLVSATGTARLFPYPHVSGLQAEIS